MPSYSDLFRSPNMRNWLNSTPVCSSTEVDEEIPVTKAEVDEKVSVSLQERMNSSKHLPGLARVHNQHQQESNTLQLLAMPEKALEKILRYALVDAVAICVAADYPQESNEKHRGVLSVCHRLRELGRPIFYQENVFEVKIARFDVKAVLPWLKIVSPFLSDAEAAGAAAISNDADEESIGTESTTDIEAAQPAAPGAFDSNTNTTPVDTATPDTAHPKFGKPSARVIKIFSKSFNHFVKPVVNLDKAKPATRNQLKMLAYFLGSKLERTLIKEPALPGEVYFVPSYQPHWANLVEWMKLYHADEVGRYAYEKGDKNGSTGVQALFDFVQMEKEEGRGWAVFQTKLYALRGVLAASDERWLED